MLCCLIVCLTHFAASWIVLAIHSKEKWLDTTEVLQESERIKRRGKGWYFDYCRRQRDVAVLREHAFCTWYVAATGLDADGIAQGDSSGLKGRRLASGHGVLVIRDEKKIGREDNHMWDVTAPEANSP